MLAFLGNLHGFLGKLGGKRFLVAFAALIAVVFGAKLGITEDQARGYAELAAGYIFVQTVADKATGGATSSEKAPE